MNKNNMNIIVILFKKKVYTNSWIWYIEDDMVYHFLVERPLKFILFLSAFTTGLFASGLHNMC